VRRGLRERALAVLLAAAAGGCAGLGGIRLPGSGSRSPAAPDSAALRARWQDERLQRLEQASEEQGRLLRRMSAEHGAQLETLLAEIRALGERLAAIERRPNPSTWTAPAGAPPAAGPATEPGPVTAAGDSSTLASPATVAPAPAGEPAGGDLPAPPEAGDRLYQTAYQDLMDDRFQLALAGFRRFLEGFPRTSLSDNAQYWIAEVYYEQKQYALAVDEFRRVVDEYPGQDKVPAAYYKLALSFRALRDSETARRYLDLLIERYPDAREAQLARERRAEF
jgi:tol-pal system protein YbgF